MSHQDKRVYISYAWGGESERIVNELDADLQSKGITLIRDKRDLGFKGMIRDFMQQIGRGFAVIVVISDKYLKSANCMYELVEIAKNRDIHDRIFPLVLADADIYDPLMRLEYVKYWEAKRAKLAEAMKTVDPANLQGITDDMNLYDRIRDEISSLTSTLRDMNTLSPDRHENSNFAIMISAIKKRLGEDSAPAAALTEPQMEEPVADSGVAVPQKAKKTKSSRASKTGSENDYKGKVLKKLSRDDYEELQAERFGELRFRHVLEKNMKYLFNTLDEFHRFVILEERDLSEDRYIELEKEIRQYSQGLGDQRSAFVHVVCLILTKKVPDSLKQLIYDTRPAKYGFTEMGSHVIVVYDASENDIVYPKVITDSSNSQYAEKIQQYLNP